MGAARFSIGIDLGTTNSAIAFVPLTLDAASEVMAVAQWESPTTLADPLTLPSFLYLPDDATAGSFRRQAFGTGDWIAGLLARRKAGEQPGRVAHSVKSWLCHHAVDRDAPILPWGSDEVAAANKLSPVQASALILAHLRSAWNARFAAAGAAFAFDAQDITVTVPASFDAAAQRLTLAAAEQAGFPAHVRLLEEPQAAFYRWLEEHDQGREEWSRLPGPEGAGRHVLIVDVGGGTSDFSLFEVQAGGTAAPAIRRVAVSDHILLGGDNIDLALAHLVEPQLVVGDDRLTGSPWDHLVARCRDIKERALSHPGPPDEVFPVAVPGRGSSLIAAARSAQVSRAEIERLLLDGFFPECEADARVRRTLSGLRELGLPYATDSAVTRHLAAFLRDRPRIDAVLFNGGSLAPARLRERLCREIGKWQQSPPPPALTSSQPELAVARGAACFGSLPHRKAAPIQAGAAHAVFLEAHGRPATAGGERPEPALVCILPHGAASEETFEIEGLALELRINRPVRFQTYTSTRHDDARAGDVVPGNVEGLQPLPPLQTVARVEKSRHQEPGRTIPVTLAARLNALGLLQVSCRSADPRIRQSWPLDFDLRRHERAAEAPMPAAAATAASTSPVGAPDVATEALQTACAHILTRFAQAPGGRDKLTAARLIQSLEKILGVGKGDWDGRLVRALWSPVERSAPERRHSVEHEETWLILAGYLLRPGFGAAADEARIDGLWQVREAGLCFPGRRVKIQEHILWRRVAGGLSRERQEAVLAPELDHLRRQKSPPPELIRLAGALERIPVEIKTELIGRFIDTAASLARAGGHCAPFLAALGLLLNRAPLYAGQEAIVPPQLVEDAYRALSGLDWSAPELAELQTLFLRAARMVDDRRLDVPASLRSRIADKLEKLKVSPARTARLRGFMPVQASERLGLFGESLPAGLILGDGPAD